MAARVESFPVPAGIVRRLAPVVTWGALAALILLLKKLIEPRLPRMSDEWLQNYDRASNDRIE